MSGVEESKEAAQGAHVGDVSIAAQRGGSDVSGKGLVRSYMRDAWGENGADEVGGGGGARAAAARASRPIRSISCVASISDVVCMVAGAEFIGVSLILSECCLPLGTRPTLLCLYACQC